MSPAEILAWQRRLQAASLTAAARLVGMALSLRVNVKSGACFPSKACLAEDTGLSEETIRRAVGALVGAGLVGVEHSQGRRTNRYRLAPVASNPLASEGVDSIQPPHQRGSTPSPARINPLTSEGGKEQIKEQKKEKSAPAATRDRATPLRIPANWQPDAAALAWIRSFDLTPQDAAPVVEEFRSYWASRSKRYANWSLAFKRNSRVEAGLIRLRNAKSGARHPGGGQAEPSGAAYRPFRFD